MVSPPCPSDEHSVPAWSRRIPHLLLGVLCGLLLLAMRNEDTWAVRWKKRSLWVAVALVGLGLATAAVGALAILPRLGGSRPAENPEPSVAPLDPRVVQRGRAVYQAYCAQCHGANAEGQPNWRQQNADTTYPPPPHDSTGHTWHHSDGLLYRIVRDGGKFYEDPGFKSAMPALGDRLSPEEIRAVISYLKSLWGSKERSFQAQVSLEEPFP